ncbi:transposon Ty3-G Gag-Pol polyprotein [Trichonephila clavipes]|uniref:Transposon Ty3-G Gag-Pol polyprotein n=1 Tax=Trichonephila clavipes TaxID=2585209 RepID=A0A8X6RRJ3_TRICX|nr:transposon Ty3-G Gag-Pol polyprotein [Trichonephila clavipes]
MLGCNRIHSTSYHPQANGIIERLHRHLKGALKARNHIQWTELLPIVLLGMRSALKDDINATCAQLVYGTTLRLLSDLVTSDSINQTANSTYVTSLIQTMRSLNPVSTAQHGTQNIYINPSLKTCSHIFLRSDKVNPPLTPPYTGPHLVISRNDKNFIIELNGKQSTVSIDRIKPAYLLADVTDHSDLVQTQTIIEKPVSAAPNPSIPYTTRYGRKEGSNRAPSDRTPVLYRSRQDDRLGVIDKATGVLERKVPGSIYTYRTEKFKRDTLIVALDKLILDLNKRDRVYIYVNFLMDLQDQSKKNVGLESERSIDYYSDDVGDDKCEGVQFKVYPTIKKNEL